ncbi:trans-sulfuration enzyme family protein [Oenococcus kitaharae]|uniref:trans-sulfuration enzyme family protein n=1 Tax=Oenococcus TaxID=46254 RepID=UPI0021E8373C|nr:PLP-dependent aspartate aminotransferase family protein [Oenococcus kitaharae]MCV3295957.1 PLP-dependent aspartate aminotransferase family protein [Oenococcus kitaharae]
MSDFSDPTKIIKLTTPHDPENGALNTPIYMTSTFSQPDLDHFHEFDYARSGNPTRQAGEKALAQLEGAEYGYLFSTGMAAISSVLLTFSAGDHLVISGHVYGGTYRVLNEILTRFNISHSYADFCDPGAVEAAIKPNTKALYIETPSNPTLDVTDIAAISQIAKAHHLITIADNTFMSPYLQKPLSLGADIVVHSATKFLSGHSDLLAGAVMTNKPELAKQIYFIQNAVGATLSSFDTWLLLRGLKTLAVRLDRSSSSALKLASWLENQPQVVRVLYPGLPSHPGYEIQQKQAKNGGAVFSFDIGSEAAVRTFVAALKIPIFSVSLGATETIVSYPPKMSHAELSAADLKKEGITPGLLRVSVGLEDVDDLIADFKQALGQIK